MLDLIFVLTAVGERVANGPYREENDLAPEPRVNVLELYLALDALP